jgi:acyl dehydratase
MATVATSNYTERQFIPPVLTGTRCSDWLCVTQGQIDAFAAATGDMQSIHRSDAEHANGLFRGPIAHGLLLVSLAMGLARESGALPDATWVLYGFEKLRFRAPVRSGARVRCLTTVNGVRKLAGKTLLNVRYVMEIQDERIPAFVADCLLLNLGRASDSAAAAPDVCLAG